MVNSLFYFYFLSKVVVRLCIFIVFVVCVHSFNAYANDTNENVKKQGFLSDRYRGWLWFEEKQLAKPKKDSTDRNPADLSITPEDAKNEIEELKEKMEEKRNIMIARPSPETVRDYVVLEEIMWRKALALNNAHAQAKFRYPQYFDKLQNPENVHAVKFKRKLDSEVLENKIKDFATKFDLVFFSRGGCAYCIEFAPVLKRFSDMYGFNTEEASIDGHMSGLFKGKQMADLAKTLGIKATPTVVVVSKDGKNAFELIRGYVDISELEEYVGLAVDYVQDQQIKALGGKTRRGTDD